MQFIVKADYARLVTGCILNSNSIPSIHSIKAEVLLPRLFGTKVPGYITRALVVFELATNGIQLYAIANNSLAGGGRPLH